MNAIHLPSGLTVGCVSLALSLVSWRGSPPATGTSHRSVRPLFSSMSYVVTGTTASDPSGVMAGSPSRLSAHIFSAVSWRRGIWRRVLRGGGQREAARE